MEGGISDYSVFNSFRTLYTLYRFATSSLGEFGNLFLNALLVFQPDRVEVLAESHQPAPQCPSCGTPAQRVQSRYERHLDDLPWQGLAVRLVLRLRRFFCDLEECPRRIFAETIPEIAPPKARKTARLI